MHSITKKWSTLRYYKSDVADACGISRSTLERHCRAKDIRLEQLSLTQLVEFINSYPKTT